MREHTLQERALAIESFAHTLSELRESVGNPSFRTLSGRSGAISHTTLHEAVQGNRLPSWHTTAEFVRACGAEPADYRATWELAAELVPVATAKATTSPELPPVISFGEQAIESKQRNGRTGWYVGLGAAIVTAVAVAAWGLSSPTGQANLWGSEDSAPSASDCPIEQADPPAADPASEGDAIDFIADVTLPDCVQVEAGSMVVKTWRFKNAGSVLWKDYTLQRLDPQGRNDCQTVPEIAVSQTAPGKVVDVSTPVMVPEGQESCYARFKMRNANGEEAFPASRPVFFHVLIGEEAEQVSTSR